MGSYGLTDIVATVTVPKSEYENLVRDSEKLRTLKEFIRESSNSLPLVFVKHLLGIDEGEINEKEVVNNTYSSCGNCAPCNCSE